MLIPFTSDIPPSAPVLLMLSFLRLFGGAFWLQLQLLLPKSLWMHSFEERLCSHSRRYKGMSNSHRRTLLYTWAKTLQNTFSFDMICLFDLSYAFFLTANSSPSFSLQSFADFWVRDITFSRTRLQVRTWSFISVNTVKISCTFRCSSAMILLDLYFGQRSA